MYVEHRELLIAFIAHCSREKLFKRQRVTLDAAVKMVEDFEASDLPLWKRDMKKQSSQKSTD